MGLPDGLKYLPVTGVMPHEGNLGEHEGEKRGIQHLHPEEIRRDEDAQCQEEETQILQGFAGIINRLAVEQPLLGEEPPQLSILMGVRVRLHPVRPLELMLRWVMGVTPLLRPETEVPWPSAMGHSPSLRGGLTHLLEETLSVEVPRANDSTKCPPCAARHHGLCRWTDDCWRLLISDYKALTSGGSQQGPVWT